MTAWEFAELSRSSAMILLYFFNMQYSGEVKGHSMILFVQDATFFTGCRSFGTTPQMGFESQTNVDFHARSICRNPIGSTGSSSRRDTSH
jgi:hypothetical protein